jgi:NDP-hexose 4-ketoreductase
MTRPRLLVLGAGGFLGRHVTETLEATDGVDLALVSRSATGANGHPIDLGTADRRDLGRIIRAVRPDVIINCSGVTRGSLPALIRGNVVLVAELLAAVAAEDQACRVVHLGSAAEYGAVPVGTPVTEETPPNPVGAYGIAKLAGSELVLAAARAGDCEAIVLRVFNPIGTGVPVNTVLGRAAQALRAAIRAGDDRIRLGSLDDERDFVDVRDVADAVRAAALLPGRIGAQVLNVGSGTATLVRDAVARLAAAANFQGAVEEDEPVAAAPRVSWQQADISSAARVLGWQPARSLGDAIEAVWSGSAGQASER